eukprot:TRINITY_DN3627_c0_g2_i1.p1 TRINITY_DN3627_c0_g2~~TRINITY_DN3627_c0_g2_i1.p1  ORF type:complete len:107 (-),score=0.46 TRINITY_DN3627_c0_g2_i1:1-321(-)
MISRIFRKKGRKHQLVLASTFWRQPSHLDRGRIQRGNLPLSMDVYVYCISARTFPISFFHFLTTEASFNAFSTFSKSDRLLRPWYIPQSQDNDSYYIRFVPHVLCV